MGNGKINVAIVGLGFGAEFIPIYQKYPNVNMYAVCQRNQKSLCEIADHFGIEARYGEFEYIIKDPTVDAVHINSPIGLHAEHTIAALNAGKHVACTVPMATSIEDCQKIVEAQEKSGKKYMMMETVLYSREFLFVKELYESGELGKIQFLQASHQQDMDGWPDYWKGMPPMFYATHCVAPCLGLNRSEAESVSCLGSGTIREELITYYGSPFAVESAQINFRRSDLSARVYRSLFDTARQYRESFDVYGSKRSFEWQLTENDKPVIHTAKKLEHEIPEKITIPDYAHILPKEIRSFTKAGVYDESNKHLSFTQGGGHGGSHPHLVHQFLDAIFRDADPYPNARQSANITCVGILAHESALRNGEKLDLPEFSLTKEKTDILV